MINTSESTNNNSGLIIVFSHGIYVDKAPSMIRLNAKYK